MTIAPLERVGRPVATGRPASARKSATAAPLQDAFEEEHALEVRDDIALQTQRAQYDFMTQERAELAREFNDTRSFILEQAKLDDEVLKKYIAMI